MFKLRFFIAVLIYLSVSVMLPFFIKLPAKMYWLIIGAFTVGYLIPSVLTFKKKLLDSAFIWLPATLLSLLTYDFAKSRLDESHEFLANWQKFYTYGLLVVLGIHLYTRFISEFILKQLTRK